jgi:hypothetical protein
MPSISGPALIAGGLGAAGSIGSALISSNASSNAAQATQNAANQANATQMAMYNQTRSDLSPFISTGGSAMSQLANLFGFGSGGSGAPNSSAITSALTQFPGYQFGLQQGQQALDRSAASSGLLLSGAQLKAAQQYGTNYALQQGWQPYISTLQSFANLGENAAAGLGNNGVSAGQGIAQTTASAGAVNAANAVSQGNILNSGLSQLGSLANKWWPGGGSSGTTMTMANAPADIQAAWDGLY